MTVKKSFSLRRLRLAVQLITLAGFLWLFLSTEYRGVDELPYPVSLLFRMDPLAALADALSSGSFAWKLLWPALVLTALTFVFGRFFCGWVCPLGTAIDGLGKIAGRGKKRVSQGWRKIKYFLLIILSVSALSDLQLFGIFDPLSIFLRSLTVVFFPIYNLGANSLFDFFYNHDIPLLSQAVNAGYPFFRDNLMAFHQPYFTGVWLILTVFLLIIFLEKTERRFWCKNLCPLGGLLGICSRYSFIKRTPTGLCDDCSVCSGKCRMGAVTDEMRKSGECILCMDCTDYCPREKVSFGFGSGKTANVNLSRRGVLVSIGAGLIAAPAASVLPDVRKLNAHMLRPPGAADETEFLGNCIRCGECMKVCIGGALHPAFLEAGLIGLWTPVLVPRLGYCEFNCTLCGQVCPTGAITRLPIEEKKQTIIGIAVFDKDRCLPYARGEECMVCEEHCPTAEKAIVFDEKEVILGRESRILKVPRVIEKLCIGCGICENKCPVGGVSAIRVINEIESRKPAYNDMWE